MSDKQSLSTQKASASGEPMATLRPPVDIFEDEAGITVIADLPGVSKEALNVKVDGDALTIEGDASIAAPADIEVRYSEVRTPRYRRSFTLSRELDAEKIEAHLRDGVLKLRIPKSEAARPKRIEIQTA